MDEMEPIGNTTVEDEDSSLGFAPKNFSDLRCGRMDDHYLKIWSEMQWWCEGIFFTAFGIAGLIANLFSIGILATQEMRKHSFNQLLIALAVFDILFIIVSVPVYSFTLFELFVGNQVFSLLYVHFLYPMSPVALCASIYMTLAITVERYLAVCKPLLYRNLSTTMTSFKRAAMYVMPVALVSVCLNIPKFMETQANVGDNSTEIEVTDMRLNPTYMLYYTISQIFHPMLTTGILPMALLIYMNTSIFLGIRRTTAMRNQRRLQVTSAANNNNNTNNSEGGRGNVNNQRSASDRNLAFVLIGIVIMHLLCHCLRVFLAGVAVHLIKDTVHCMREEGGYVPPLWTMVAESVSSLMIMINFSGNFLIYCSVLKPFKEALSKLVLHCQKPSSGDEPVVNLPLMEPAAIVLNPPSKGSNVKSIIGRLRQKHVVTLCVTTGDTAAGNSNAAPESGTSATNGPGLEERRRRLMACPQERTRAALIAQNSLKKSFEEEDGEDKTNNGTHKENEELIENNGHVPTN